jgi:hypothetical protein
VEAQGTRTGAEFIHGHDFRYWRFAYAGPQCAAPPSWGRHPQTFTKTEVASLTGMSLQLSRVDIESQVLRASLVRPLNELCRSSPSDVMSRNSISAVNDGSTQVALSFLIGFVSFDFRLTTVSSCFLIWLDTVLDQPVPTLLDLAEKYDERKSARRLTPLPSVTMDHQEHPGDKAVDQSATRG